MKILTKGCLSLVLSGCACAGFAAPGNMVNAQRILNDGEFSLHGAVDIGIRYDRKNGEDSVYMASTNSNFNRIDFRGIEYLGNGGQYVRFLLRNQTELDSGELRDKAFFDQAMVAFGGEFGEIAFGRIGNIRGPLGDYGIFPVVKANPTGTTCDNNKLAPVFLSGGSSDNSIVFASKRYAGLAFTLQYVNGNGDDAKLFSEKNEAMTFATTYINGGFRIAGMATWRNRDQESNSAQQKIGDTWDFMVGGSYSFEDWSLQADYQYIYNGAGPGGMGALTWADVKNDLGTSLTASKRGFDTHAIALGLGFKALGGKIGLLAAMNHTTYKGDGEMPAGVPQSGNRYLLASSYKYFLSKRTHLFAIANYSEGHGIYQLNSLKSNAADPIDRVMFVLGMHHTF